MKFVIDCGLLYPTHDRHLRDRPCNKRLAKKIANNFIRDYKAFLPLDWDALSVVALDGILEESIQIDLHFLREDRRYREVVITITDVYVGSDSEIIQAGSNYGSLMY